MPGLESVELRYRSAVRNLIHALKPLWWLPVFLLKQLSRVIRPKYTLVFHILFAFTSLVYCCYVSVDMGAWTSKSYDYDQECGYYDMLLRAYVVVTAIVFCLCGRLVKPLPFPTLPCCKDANYREQCISRIAMLMIFVMYVVLLQGAVVAWTGVKVRAALENDPFNRPTGACGLLTAAVLGSCVQRKNRKAFIRLSPGVK